MGNEPGSEKTPPEPSEPSSPQEPAVWKTRLGPLEIDYDEITVDGILRALDGVKARRLKREAQQAKQQGEKPE